MAIGRINATLTGVQPGGLAKIVPTSVAVGSGSGSVDSNGNVTFSGASSVSLNGVFSNTYDNYIINFKATASSATTALNMKLRKSGTDLSSGYDRSGVIQFNNSSTITALNANNQTAWGFPDINATFPTYTYFTFTLFSPYLTAPKQGGLFGNGVNGSTQIAGFAANFSQGDATAHDGFTLATGSGNFGGVIRVYGYNQ